MASLSRCDVGCGLVSEAFHKQLIPFFPSFGRIGFGSIGDLLVKAIVKSTEAHLKLFSYTNGQAGNTVALGFLGALYVCVAFQLCGAFVSEAGASGYNGGLADFSNIFSTTATSKSWVKVCRRRIMSHIRRNFRICKERRHLPRKSALQQHGQRSWGEDVALNDLRSPGLALHT